MTEAIHFAGRWTVRFILLSLAITPARRLLFWPKLVNARRTLGVAACCYGLLHFSLFIADQKFDFAKVASEIALRFYLTLGFTTLLGLIALGSTSTDAAVRRLGPRWNMLHRAIYVFSVFAVVHFTLQKKIDIYEPVLMMGLLSWLLTWRVLQRFRGETGVLWLAALACFAAVFTALFEAAWYGVLTGVQPSRILLANFMFSIGVRPAWWVLGAALTVTVANLVMRWLRPSEPARARLRPAE